VPPVSRRILALFSVVLLALAPPLRAAVAQQGQRLNLVRDAEIENDIHVMMTPIWKVAGLDPSAVQIMIVQDNTLNAFVAGGQRIFINTGLLMRTERPNQLIGVLAHETGHIAGGHLARAQEEMEKLSTLQILEMLLGAGAMAGGAVGGVGSGRPAPADAGNRGVPSSIANFLKYSQTQEGSADQAAMTFLERTHQSCKGAIEFLKVLQREERLAISRQDPYLTTHPLTPERIEAFEQAAARSPYTNVPDSPQNLDMHHRIVAKLMGFLSPTATLQHFAEADRSVPARYARAIALYKTGALGSALLTLDGLLKESPNDPYFNELRGQMLFENGHVKEAVLSYRRAAQLLPASGVVKVDFARTLIETNTPENDREAIRNLELAANQDEAGNFDLWRLEAAAYSRMNNPGMTSLARAEMAVLRGNRAEAQSLAAAAVRTLPTGTPAWQRAQDLAAYIDSRPKKR
jgi:predicted Zn-dependent protease